MDYLAMSGSDRILDAPPGEETHGRGYGPYQIENRDMTVSTSLPPSAGDHSPLPLENDAVQILAREYGPLLTIGDLAQVLDRSPDGLRKSFGRVAASDPQMAILRAARRPVGRRTYYDARIVARLLAPTP